MDEMRVKKSFYVEKVRGLLTALLFEIARITEREAAPHVPDSRVFGQISKALRYVDRHYAEPVRIGDLAEACSISETHFRRLFYEYIHMTPVEYLNMVRVLHACEILRSSNDTIAGVAVRCGFSTVSTLDRNFRQVLGVTPGQWKRDPKNYESRLLEVNISVQKGW
jgi:transcriptional regulator GlxA family with amidase domain